MGGAFDLPTQMTIRVLIARFPARNSCSVAPLCICVCTHGE